MLCYNVIIPKVCAPREPLNFTGCGTAFLSHMYKYLALQTQLAVKVCKYKYMSDPTCTCTLIFES